MAELSAPGVTNQFEPYWTHQKILAGVSLILAGVSMKLIRVSSPGVFVIATALLWIPLSFVLNSLVEFRKPAKLGTGPPRQAPGELIVSKAPVVLCSSLFRPTLRLACSSGRGSLLRRRFVRTC